MRGAFLPPVTTTLRKEDIAMASYTPIFNELGPDQLALLESQREKEMKRKKRAGRARRGIVLPEREPVKTQRTLLNNLGPNGVPILFQADNVPVRDSAPTSRRRGAALAAEANINLLAQDLPIPASAPPAPHLPHISARGKRLGRPPKNRAISPVSIREGPLANGGTPTTGDIKGHRKGYLDDSADEQSINGALSASGRKKPGHYNRIPDSPSEPSTPLSGKVENLPSSFHLDSQTDQTSILKKRKSHNDVDERPPKSAKPDEVGVPFPISKPASDNKIEKKKRKSSDSSGIDSDSDSGSDSGSDDSDSTFGGRKDRKKMAAGRTETPAARSSVVPTGTPGLASAASPGSGRKAIEVSLCRFCQYILLTILLQVPMWIQRALGNMRAKYSRDSFLVIQKPRPADQPDAPPEWRAKCNDW